MERKLLEIAEAAARAGGAVVRARAGDFGAVRTKSSLIDLVTDVDVASGVAVVRAIHDALPQARVIVEEPEVYELTASEPASLYDPEVWVIDPVDGTTSFVHGYPCYSVSVACLQDGSPVAGAVFNAASAECFTGAVGEGAFLDGWAIRCTEAAGVPQALLATGFPYERESTLDRQLGIFSAVIRVAHDIRRDGSAAIDCCQTACGRVDGFWELALRPWDMAAGVCILREAGALVTDTSGAPWTPATTDIVTANPRLHAALLELIAEADARS